MEDPVQDEPQRRADPNGLRRITVLSGGVGGAKFARGLRHFVRQSQPAPVQPAPAHSLTCIVNTGDDMWLNGLRVCPDLDSLMYGLAGSTTVSAAGAAPGSRNG